MSDTLLQKVNLISDNLRNIGYPIRKYTNNYIINEFPKYDNKHMIYNVNNAMKDLVYNLKIKEGTNIASIDRLLYKNTYLKSMFPSCLGLDGFPKASCISINDTVCHGVPYEIKLRDGDIVTVDYCLYNGLHSDWAHTFTVGKVSGKNKKLVQTTYDCLMSAIDLCKPGQYYREIGRIIYKIAVENGFSIIEKYGGHGIGRELHMNPFIPNIPSNNMAIMKVGDMFTIEPLVTTAKTGKTYIDKDGLSIKTINKAYAAHFERTLIITESGYEVLN